MSINVDEEAIEINDNEVQEESREYVHIEAETIQVDPLNLPFQKVSPEKVDEKTNSRRNNLVKFRETKDSFLEQMEVVTPPTHKISFDLPFKKDKMVDNSETNNPQRRSLPSFLHVDLNNLRHIRLLSTP